MKPALILLALSIASHAFGAETRPSTQPVGEEHRALADAVLAAEQFAAHTAADAVNRLHASTEYKAATARLESAAAALESARASGTPQQRLDASSQWNKARLAVERMGPEAIKADAKASSAAAEVERLRKALASAIATAEARRHREQEEADARDPVKVAVKEKRLAVGMTLEQANAAMGSDGVLKEEDADGNSFYRWPIYVTEIDIPPQGGFTTGVHTVRERLAGYNWAIVRKGRVTQWGKM